MLAGLVFVLATREPASSRLADSPLLGKRAPALAGTSLLDDEEFDLDGARGRYVLVNMFATWCTPCVKEHPELVSFARRHEAAGDATVVSVVFRNEPEEARAFFRENGGEWPVLPDDDGRMAVDWGVSGVPESYLVSPEGRVLSKIVGGVRTDDLDRLLAEAKAAA